MAIHLKKRILAQKWIATPTSRLAMTEKKRILGETPLLSLRGSGATEAKQGEAEASLVIHTQKADSSMDRHADKSARDDRKTRSARNLKTPQDSRICDEKALFYKRGRRDLSSR